MTSAFSYGGGVQSTAALVLTVQGEIDYPVFLFANVGDDAEHPATLRYVREVAMPYAAEHGIELVELQRRMRDGTIDTLMRKIDRTESSIPLPARMMNGAPGNRICTEDFKIKVVAKELRRRGATKEQPALVGLGITVDEIHRVRSGYDPRVPEQRREYPLVDMELTRQDCVRVIEQAGMPVPPKSSCFFCPFHRMTEWMRLKREEPELFAQACELEQKLIDRRARLGKDPVWLTRFALPLAQAVGEGVQLTLDDDSCEEGWCHT